MQYALDTDGRKVEALKGLEATCPACRAPVTPKCGKIKVHHWAHSIGLECDCWFEPETEWHRNWKALFKPESVEVVLGPDRADIYNGITVVELQNSAIPPAEIALREKFYKNMIWIVNAANFSDRFFLMRYLGDTTFTFRWKHTRPTWLYARKPVYLDFGPETVESLLGAKKEHNRNFYTNDGREGWRTNKTVVRYGNVVAERGIHTLTEFKADTQFEELADSLKPRNLLRIKTLYDSGNGSASALCLDDLFRAHRLNHILR